MFVNEKVPELKDDFLIRQIKMISELYEAEIFLNEKILNIKNIQTKNFVLLDKDWLDQWKIIVDYEQIKNKCNNTENINEIKDEISKLFIKLKTEQRLEELGKMDCSKFQRNNYYANSRHNHLDKLGNYLPVLDSQCNYFSYYIQWRITVQADILEGKIYIHDYSISKKDKEKKLILLYQANNDFKRGAIILENNAKIKNVIKELKNIKIEELLNNKELEKEILNKVNINKIEDEK